MSFDDRSSRGAPRQHRRSSVVPPSTEDEEDEWWPSTQATLEEYRAERHERVKSHDGLPAHTAVERPPSPGGPPERGREPEDKTVARIQAAFAQLEDSRNRASEARTPPHANVVEEQQPLRLRKPLRRRLVDTWKGRKGRSQTKNGGRESEQEDQGYPSKTGRRRDSELSVISPSVFDPDRRLLDEKHMTSQVLNGIRPRALPPTPTKSGHDPHTRHRDQPLQNPVSYYSNPLGSNPPNQSVDRPLRHHRGSPLPPLHPSGSPLPPIPGWNSQEGQESSGDEMGMRPVSPHRF